MERQLALATMSLLAAAAAAQEARSPLSVDALLVPVHGRSADPDGGQPGLWAAGPAYKARFHDGFAFYPVLGKSYPRNLPLRWRTESVSANGQPLTTAGAAPSVKSSAFCVEYDYGNVSERYDVRADGVEQSFVIAHRPASPGAIEVRARIETELVAAPASGHVAIDFCDAEGNPLVRYGEAFAIDAAGRKVDVTSTFDGERILLTVPAAFAETAIYPLTIDPLTTALQVTTGSGVVEDVAVGSCPNATTRNTLVALTRYSSVSDLDLFVVSCSDDWTMSLVVYSDIDAQWSSANPSVGACEGASRWVVAFQRDFTSPAQSTIRAYLHDVNNTTFDSGPLMTVTLNVSNTHRNPQVGGATGALGKKALVVWQTDATTIQANTVNTEVNGRVIDVASKSFSGAAFPLRAMASGNVDREYPAVTRTAEEDGSWITVWQQFDNTNVGDDWDLQGNRITQAGAVVGSDPALSNGKPIGHSIRPKIAGQAGRYLVAWTDSTGPGATTGLNVYARCFTWAENNTGPTNTEPVRLIENVLAGFGTLALDGVAHDFHTRSHWAVQFRHQHPGVVGSVRVTRVGGSAGIVEEQVCFSNDGPMLASDVAFHKAGTETYFQVAFKASISGNPVVGLNLLYANAGASAYGTPCGGTVSMMPPLAGDELYSTGIGNITPNTPAVLFLSAKSASLSLAVIGMSGCMLHVDTTTYVPLSTTSDANGQASMPLPLPDFPAFKGDFYTQWFWIAPGTNQLGVRGSQGVKHAVR